MTQLDHRLYTVEALRGLAALAVAWSHFSWTNPHWVVSLGGLGAHGVDVFFVISGFIIPYSLHTSAYSIRDFGRFMVRRLIRLEPPYLASIILAVVLWELAARTPGFAGQVPSFAPEQIAAHFLYLVPFTGHSWVSGVYWTLAYEFMFYIGAGLLWPILARLPIAATAAVFFVISAAAYHLTGNFLPCIFFFLVGIAGVRYFVGISGAASALLVVAIGTVVLAYCRGPLSAITGLATVAAIVFVEFPRWRALSFLAAISYSLYLAHLPIGNRIVNLGKRVVDGAVPELCVSLLALAVSIVCAAIFWWLLEAPAMRASKRIKIGKGARTLGGHVAPPLAA